MREAIYYQISEKDAYHNYLSVINNLEANHIFIQDNYSIVFMDILKKEVIKKYPSIVIVEDLSKVPISITYWDDDMKSQVGENELRRVVNDCLCDALKKTQFKIEHYQGECNNRFFYPVIERCYIHEGKKGEFEDVVEYAYWKGYRKGTKCSFDDIVDVLNMLQEYAFLQPSCENDEEYEFLQCDDENKVECKRYDKSNLKAMKDDMEENLDDSRDKDMDANEDENYLDEELPFS